MDCSWFRLVYWRSGRCKFSVIENWFGFQGHPDSLSRRLRHISHHDRLFFELSYANFFIRISKCCGERRKEFWIRESVKTEQDKFVVDGRTCRYGKHPLTLRSYDILNKQLKVASDPCLPLALDWLGNPVRIVEEYLHQVGVFWTTEAAFGLVAAWYDYLLFVA